MKVCMIVCCPVYIVVRLMLFHYRCVSVEHVYESLYDCVLSCIYCRTSYVISFVSVRACVWKFVWLCCPVYLLSYESLYDCVSYVLCYFIIGVCVSESMCMKVCMIVCCPVYIVVRLMLFHYRCVSVRACVWKFVWLCVVLYILSYVLCYFTIGVCQLEHVYESLYDCVSCPVYIVVPLMLFHYMCV